MADQTKIGWDNALVGILAISWIDVARHGNRPLWEAERGIQVCIKGLIHRAKSLWEGRNQALHGTKEQELSKVYTVESAAIRYYHSRPHLLASGDRHYCKRPLLKILRGAPATRRRWLLRVRQARAAYLRDGQHQRQLTSYFNRSSRTHAPQDTNTDERGHLHNTDTAPTTASHGIQNSRRRTTMQRTITTFFPSARPPDQLSIPLPGHTAYPQNPRS